MCGKSESELTLCFLTQAPMNRTCELFLLLHVLLRIKEAWDIEQLWSIFAVVSVDDLPAIISLYHYLRACTCKAVQATGLCLPYITLRH